VNVPERSAIVFDHERLEVYQAAIDFAAHAMATKLIQSLEK